MAATNITFDDKILGQANALPENKKLTFANANEIKTVVNNNATELTSTQANVATNTSGIATNVADIATNVADIATNTNNIAANTTNIATNVTNIATNTSGIATNVSNISTNTTDIATNTSDIATNVSNISTNTTNISTNTSGIATNTTNITTNTTNIATNATNIATNTSDINALDGRVTTNESNIASNTSALDLKANLSGATFTGDVVAPDFIGDLNGAVRFEAKNDSGSTLLKGKVVAITGVQGNNTLVDLADADDATARPAFGLVYADANNNTACEVVTFGNLSGLNTSAFTEGDTLYVSTVAGELVNVAPTGEAADIQNIGKVIRSHASAGIIKVGGAGRANATPNLDSGKMFLGNASNQSESVAMSGDVTIDNTGATTVGTINSVAVATVTSGAALGTTSIQKNVGATYTTNALTTLTQAEYDAIDTPDATTIYFII
jgi:trimeric autotransporter adhesin